MTAIVCLAVGVLVGWNLPQPQFTKDLQAKAIAWIKSKI